MLDRRSFISRTSIAVAGGLLVGDAALELFERLTLSKVFALGELPMTASDILARRDQHNRIWGTYIDSGGSVFTEEMLKKVVAKIENQRPRVLIGYIEIAPTGHLVSFNHPLDFPAART